MQLADLLGIIGGLAGLLALAVQGYLIWQKRKPDLKLFVPYNFSGDHTESGQRMMFCLVRISNLSERPAYVYFETLKAEVLYKNRWHPVEVPSFSQQANMDFDLPEAVQFHTGVKQIPFFNKFSSPVISLDNPYSRYFAVTCHDRGAIDHGERLRLEFKDCNLTKHVLEAEILKNDPEHVE
ncbi:MAG: hypothetical protein JJU03_07450 [Idiomarina sp.]|nr:hypothetical protein [Idiomarina sp.]